MMLMLLSAFFFCHVMLTDNAVERSLLVTFGAAHIPVYSLLLVLRQPYLVMKHGFIDTLVHQDRKLAGGHGEVVHIMLNLRS